MLKEENSSKRKAIQSDLDGVPPHGHTWSPSATDLPRELVSEEQVVRVTLSSGWSESCWGAEGVDTRGHRVAGKMFMGRVMEHSSNHIMVELVNTSHPTEDHNIHKQMIMVG